ncbi:hypothetical protein ID866_9264 [Astraeus odoratus]|nr:hypothetical protein ID866_9264 [Astraeus odoratus]
MSTAAIHQALPLQVEQVKAKAQAECAAEDWELVSEASLNPNSEDDKAMASLWKKVKEDHVTEKATERRQRHEQEEQRAHKEAEQREQEEAEQKKKEEAWRIEEAKKKAEQAEQAAEVQRRTAERQCKLSIVIPMGGSSHRSATGPSLGTRAPCDRCMSWRPPLRCELGMARGKLTVCKPCHKAKVSCSWSKAAGGMMHKQRRMQTKEDNKEDDKNDEDDGEGDSVVLPALAQEHRDALGTLTTTLSMLLKEFRGYHCKQWDLHACQLKGLKALQREMRKVNTLKAKELEATSKGKEKAAEVMEELLESGEEVEEEGVKGRGNDEGGVTRDEGDNGDGDVEMGVAPLASAM